MNLINKLREARKVKITVDKYEFTVMRPTDMEMATLGGSSTEDVFKKYVIGWNVQEIDIIPGGSPVTVTFDSVLFYDWVSDHPELWNPITDAIINSYKSHLELRAENEKK